MAAMDEVDSSNLLRLFDDVFQMVNGLDKNFESTSGEPFQNEVKKIKQMLEDLTRMVSSIGTFSSNEEIDEVSTNDLRFFLLPALLGSVTVKSNCEERLSLLQTADIYFRDFLQRCSDYGISEVDEKYFRSKEAEGGQTETVPDLIAMAKQREEKLRRYKRVKDIESKLEDYKVLVEKETVDDEIKRKYFLTLINFWVCQSIDELENIDKEKTLLERFAGMSEAAIKAQNKKPAAKPLKPVILTKNALQKKVYGLGYPSIPTMTVDEFYEKKIQEGTFSIPDKSLQSQGYDRTRIEENDQIEKEEAEDRDDPESIKKARDWDDWKDDNKRGWGNRKNKG